MKIRRAEYKDLEGLNRLLSQVLMVHYKGRSDIFKPNVKKYKNEELLVIIEDDLRPIFVAEENEKILGYVFCIFKQHTNNNILTDIKTLYIDDLCIDENCRGKGVGKFLYEYVVDFAKKAGCYNLTLNVWSCNEGAIRFYEKMGLVPQKVEMEKIL